MKNSIKATGGPSLQLMTTRPTVRLNFIRIFSKVGNLGQGVYIELGKSGVGVCRYAMNIAGEILLSFKET